MTGPTRLQKLKERKLVQWAIAYLAGAFFIYSALEPASDAWGIPANAIKAVHVLLGVGLFVTVVLAWYHGEQGRQRVSGAELLIIALLLLTSAGVVSLVWGGARSGGDTAADTVRPDAEQGAGRPSIAVLPLDNLSPSADDAYFADGVQEDITTALAGVSSLAVRGRSSVEQYRDRAHRPGSRTMASSLGVDYLLEGSARVVGNVAKVTVQLIDGRVDEHVWADEYEARYVPEEVIRIQSEIARQVANHLRVEVAPGDVERIGSAVTADRDALRLYHQGRYLWNKRTEQGAREAIRLFQRAIDRDANFAAAYVGLADCYLILGNFAWEGPNDSYPLARAAADRALNLDASSAGAHVTLGGVHLWYTRDWAAAERHFREAIRLDPDQAFAHYWYSLLLDALLRQDEALTEITLARDLDPLAPQIDRGFAGHFVHLRDFNRSIMEYTRLAERYPEFGNGFSGLCEAYAAAGRYADAEAACEQARTLLGAPPGSVGLALVYALQGDRARALKEVEIVRDAQGGERIHPVYLARIYVALGDFDEAMTLLDEAMSGNHPYLSYLSYDAFFDPIRADPRFIALIEALGLPVSTPS